MEQQQGIIEKNTQMFQEIPILQTTLDKIKRYCALARGSELYGFLTTPCEQKDGIVRDALLAYGQSVSPASGHLSQEMAAFAKAELENNKQLAIGFWHSHGNFGVFHSGTDDANLATLSGSLASQVEERYALFPNDENKKNPQIQELIFACNQLQVRIGFEEWYSGLDVRGVSQHHLARYAAKGKVPVAVFFEDPQRKVIRVEVQREKMSLLEVVCQQPTPQESDHYVSRGIAYSIVSNQAGDIYAEMVKSTWCSACEQDSISTLKDVKLRVLQQEGMHWTDEQLKEDLQTRVQSGLTQKRYLTTDGQRATGFFKKIIGDTA